MVSILEALADFGVLTKSPEILTEYVRQALSRQITHQHVDDNGVLQVLTVDPNIEELISSSVQEGDQGSYLAMDPIMAGKILDSVAKVYQETVSKGLSPVILSSAPVRRHLKRLADRINKRIVVLSYNEVSSDVEVQSVGTVTVKDES